MAAGGGEDNRRQARAATAGTGSSGITCNRTRELWGSLWDLKFSQGRLWSAVCSDRGVGFKVEVAGFVLSASGKKDGGRDTPWSSQRDGVHIERAQSGRRALLGDGMHVVRTGGKVVAGRVQTSARRENFTVSRLSRWCQTQSPL